MPKPPPRPVRVDPECRYLAEHVLDDEKFTGGSADDHRARVLDLAEAIQMAITEWRETHPQ